MAASIGVLGVARTQAMRRRRGGPSYHRAVETTTDTLDVAGGKSAQGSGERGLVIGRDPPPGGLRLPFGSVSRLHARVVATVDGVAVDDLESHNGTFVNGTRATTQRRPATYSDVDQRGGGGVPGRSGPASASPWLQTRPFQSTRRLAKPSSGVERS